VNSNPFSSSCPNTLNIRKVQYNTIVMCFIIPW
jgi:hypothetical protein